MAKKRVLLISLAIVFSLLSIEAKITPFVQISPYFILDKTPLLYSKWPSGGDPGFRAILNNKSIENSSETIQKSMLGRNCPTLLHLLLIQISHTWETQNTLLPMLNILKSLFLSTLIPISLLP